MYGATEIKLFVIVIVIVIVGGLHCSAGNVPGQCRGNRGQAAQSREFCHWVTWTNGGQAATCRDCTGTLPAEQWSPPNFFFIKQYKWLLWVVTSQAQESFRHALHNWYSCKLSLQPKCQPVKLSWNRYYCDSEPVDVQLSDSGCKMTKSQTNICREVHFFMLSK